MSFFNRKSVITDSDRIEHLLTRGVESVIPKELAIKKLASGLPLRLYLGIDPTGSKLHLGHSVPLRKLQQFSNMGHHIIFLVGSFTAMIGDPSGRDTLREPLTLETVKQNFQTYKKQAAKILDFSRIEVRYNDEWLSKLTFNEIVKFSSLFTVQQMIQRDMFNKRIQEGKPIGLHEFLYPLMVGYDSLVLDVDGEIGGSDQEFNMLAGRHLQSAITGKDKFVLTTPLIGGLDGRKMSKSYNNCIYLEDSPQEMFGKLMSLRDELVKTYFEACTDISTIEIATICSGHPKVAKMKLAREIVTIYYNAEIAKNSEKEFDLSFTKGEFPESAPTVSVLKGTPLHEALKLLNESKTELRRLALAGAIEDMGKGSLTDINKPIENAMNIRVGKHRFFKILVK